MSKGPGKINQNNIDLKSILLNADPLERSKNTPVIMTVFKYNQ